MSESEPKKMGRPKRILDEAQLRVICRLMGTLEDCASYFRCSKTTISEYCKSEFNQTFREFRDESFIDTRLELRQLALQKAKKKDDILKFCLKNMDGWVDRISTESIELEDKPSITLSYSLLDDISVTNESDPDDK